MEPVPSRIDRSKYYRIDMLKHIFDQNQRIRKLNGPDIWERHLVAAQEHIEIITAILEEEYTHAAELMRKHLDYSKSTSLIIFPAIMTIDARLHG